MENFLRSVSLLPILGLGPIYDNFVVHLGYDSFALDLNLNFKPIIVDCRSLQAVLYAIDAGGFFRVMLSVINLVFKPCPGPPLVLKASVEVDTGIGVGEGHDLCLKYKIFKRLVCLVK